jgi:hypothetical protein
VLTISTSMRTADLELPPVDPAVGWRRLGLQTALGRAFVVGGSVFPTLTATWVESRGELLYGWVSWPIG